MLARSLNLLQILDGFALPRLAGFLFQHLAISNNRVQWCAQFVAHVGQECALRPARIFRRVFCLEKLFLCLLPLGDLPLQLLGSRVELIVGIQQCGVALLDFRQHVVEAVHHPANFVPVGVFGTYLIVLVGRHHSYGVFELENRPRDHSLQFRGNQQRE